METSTKRVKERDDQEDRISNLPPELIGKILSFLESVEAVRTCVLSSKWRYIWSFVPSIILNGRLFSTLQKVNVCIDFDNFCYNLFRRRQKVDLDTFRLTNGYYFDTITSPTARWIIYAVNLNPRLVDLDLHVKGEVQFPECLFVCQTLENLKCQSAAPNVVNLPRLRTLKICNTKFSEDYMLKLNFGCPVLEDLTVENCHLDLSVIFSSTLRKLTLNNCLHVEKGVNISIPTLTSLYVRSHGGALGLMNMSSLVSARIEHFYGSCFGSMKFLQGLANVRHLSLYGPSLKGMIERDLHECPIFFDLKSLYIGEFQGRKKDIPLIVSFLERIPNLENLELENIMGTRLHKQGKMLFHFERLKDAQAQGYEGNRAHEFVRALLMNNMTPMNANIKISW